MRHFIGIDPDMHTMPVAIVDEVGRLTCVRVFEVSRKLKGQDALLAMSSEINRNSFDILRTTASTVEAQEIYQFGKGKTANPKSIMLLATVAGMALHAFQGLQKTYFPLPREWKGNVPKQIHQARVLGKMLIPYEKVGSKDDGYCIPTYPTEVCKEVKPSHWKHVVDAIGLAQWGREKFLEAEQRKLRKILES